MFEGGSLGAWRQQAMRWRHDDLQPAERGIPGEPMALRIGGLILRNRIIFWSQFVTA